MKVTRQELTKARNQVTDPELRGLYDSAIRSVLDNDIQGMKDERLMRKVAFYLPVWIFGIGTIATLVLIFLATLKVVQLDDRYLNILVKAFVGEMVAAGIWALRRVWRK